MKTQGYPESVWVIWIRLYLKPDTRERLKVNKKIKRVSCSCLTANHRLLSILFYNWNSILHRNYLFFSFLLYFLCHTMHVQRYTCTLAHTHTKTPTTKYTQTNTCAHTHTHIREINWYYFNIISFFYMRDGNVKWMLRSVFSCLLTIYFHPSIYFVCKHMHVSCTKTHTESHTNTHTATHIHTHTHT